MRALASSAALALLVGVCPHAVIASGFGLYEASTESYALGGTCVGRACDASANFYNPATLTDLERPTVTAGFMTEHPRGRMKIDGEAGYATMDPGCFVLPYFHAAVPLPWDFAFGLGLMPEYGLGSAYDENWALAANSIETTVTSVTLNPNLAWKITDDWSVGGGIRLLYFDFEQYSRPFSCSPTGRRLGLGRVEQRLKGDNGMKDWGWQIGTKYDVRDDLSLGVVYKSRTVVNVEGSSRMNYAADSNGKAETELTLPQSVTGGFNWDISEDWHLGGAVAWTEWSSVDVLDFHLGKINKDINLNWIDTWRFALAPSWDFAEDWTAIASYVFETDCSRDQDSTMLPPSERHMISAGLVWRFSENWELSASYGMILMDGLDSACTTTDPVTKQSVRHVYSAHRALSHAAGFGVTYRF